MRQPDSLRLSTSLREAALPAAALRRARTTSVRHRADVAARLALVGAVVFLTARGMWTTTRPSFHPLHLTMLVHVGWMAPALGGFLVLLALEGRRPVLGRAWILAGAGAMVAAALAVPARESTDVWSYAMYGRMLVAHHANPYLVAPSAFPTDPWLARIPAEWRSTPSLYGPVFTAWSAFIVSVLRSPGAAALGFQATAAAAVAGCLWLVARRTRSSAALIFLGLNPLVAADVVNGGHPDALVGLLVLAATLLVEDGAWWGAGAAGGLGVLIKATALFPLAGLTLWVWRKAGLRAAAVVGGLTAAVTLPGYAAFHAVDAFVGRVRSHLVQPWVPWALPDWWREIATGRFGARHMPVIFAHLESLSVPVTVLVAALLVLPRLGDANPRLAVGAAVLATVLAGAWVLPWYAFLGLPVLALEWRSGIARAALATFAVEWAGYLMGFHSQWADLVRTRMAQGVGWIETAMLVAILLGLSFLIAYRRGSPSPRSAAYPSG